MKNPTVYILTNKMNGTLYIGVTSNLIKRIYDHKNHVIEGFTKRYNCILLVYYEEHHETMEAAITREKKLKGGSRWTKIRLIESNNPPWNDLYDSLL